MGRLTLNVLLSFTQFEREVIGERVRDKIAASKRRGIWVGGPVPLGYRSVDKKLETVPEDAALVRKIFADHLRLGSIGELASSLEQEGIKPRPRLLANGTTIAADRFMVGPLAHLLKNRFYIGDVVFQGETHQSEHQPILDRDLFDAVQAQLADVAVKRRLARSPSPAMLTGLIFDDRGNPMTPSHANKKGVRVMRTISTTKPPLISVGTMYQASTFHMVSLKSKPISKAEDLKDKIVGIVSVGGTTEVYLDLDLILAKGGIAKHSVKHEVTGNSPGALQMVKQGRVDCFIASIQVVVALQQRMKEEVEVWSTDRYAPMPDQCCVSSRDMINVKSEVFTRALRAIRASAQDIMMQPLPPIFERATKDYEIPNIRNSNELVEVEEASADRLRLSEGRENLLRNVPHLWTSGVDALRDNKIADPGEPETLYTNQFVDTG